MRDTASSQQALNGWSLVKLAKALPIAGYTWE